MSTVAIGYISDGNVATRFHESVVGLIRYQEVIGPISMISGARISSARNEIVRLFLDHPKKPEWLFNVDSDMGFTPDVVARFLAVANPKIRPVIGGLCFGGGRVGKPYPTLYTLVDPKDNHGRVTKVVHDYPVDALVKVHATGAAALFIHRDTLLQMQEEFMDTPDGYSNPHPWFCETVHQGHEYGEDWTFCMRLLSLKIPLYVHTGIKFDHYNKTQNYNEAFYKETRRKKNAYSC